MYVCMSQLCNSERLRFLDFLDFSSVWFCIHQLLHVAALHFLGVALLGRCDS